MKFLVQLVSSEKLTLYEYDKSRGVGINLLRIAGGIEKGLIR